MSTSAEMLRAPADPASELVTESVMARASGENFTVASALLPPRYRRSLLAIYGYARLVDEIGDRAGGGNAAHRLSQLDWAEDELDRALEGRAEHPVFIAAADFARRSGADRGQFVALIDANRLDQERSRYPDYAALEGYCALSANPVGRLVLSAFSVRSTQAERLSDEVCTALQVVEHLQDVVEDRVSGRIYLPVEDLEHFGVSESDLAAPCSDALRRLIAFESGRSKRLLLGAVALPRMVGGFGRLAVAGFIGGGLAQIDALERAGFDVVGAPVKASAQMVAAWTLRVLWTGARA